MEMENSIKFLTLVTDYRQYKGITVAKGKIVFDIGFNLPGKKKRNFTS